MATIDSPLENETRNETENSSTYSRKSPIRNRFNIVCRGYVKDNKAGGEIIVVVPDIPISAWLDDLLFILTIPGDDQSYAPAYIRLQDKEHYGSSDSEDELKRFVSDIKVTGYLKQKKGEIIVCAPKTHVKVDLDKIVMIATIPGDGRDKTPCYIKPKTYNPGRRAEPVEEDGDSNIDIDSIDIDDSVMMKN